MIAEYVYFGLRPVAVKNGSNINIVHTDYLTTPRIVTSGGSIVWQWRNDNPYGNNLAQGNIEFNLRFAGQYYDAESGLHYNIHRTYNPEIGRYMQSDPMGLIAGSNTYNYVGRNPFDGVDPLGLWKQQGDPADLNLFAPGTTQYNASRQLTLDSKLKGLSTGGFLVAAHMGELTIDDNRLCDSNQNDGSCASQKNGTSFFDYDTADTSLQKNMNKFIDLLAQNGWRPGQKIVLLGCHSGADSNQQETFAQSLRRRLKVDVVTVINFGYFSNSIKNVSPVIGLNFHQIEYINTWGGTGPNIWDSKVQKNKIQYRVYLSNGKTEDY